MEYEDRDADAADAAAEEVEVGTCECCESEDVELNEDNLCVECDCYSGPSDYSERMHERKQMGLCNF